MEACREEGEGERGDVRDVRDRSQTTDRPERIKPDHFPSSQGPLSSLRAAIKRTKTPPQSDHTRERRRPEITVVSAEPLAPNNWFSGASVVYPPPPQSGWSTGIGAVCQRPPSYDQVIQEKTQEERAAKPTAAPRCTSRTATSATQTDPVRENASAAVPQSTERRPAGKKPQKPPRPSPPKPLVKGSATGSVARTDEKVQRDATVPAGAEEDSHSDLNPPDPVDSALTCARTVTVHWEVPTRRLSGTAAEISPFSSDLERSQRPVPLPRVRSRKQACAEEHQVQTLVKVENCDDILSDPVEVPSNKYLKELLEVFSADKEFVASGDLINQSDEALQDDDGGEMNSGHSERDMQARIQAFELQAGTTEGNEPEKPELPPRKSIHKPPLAAKPSVALKPQFNHSVDDGQHVTSAKVPPAPAPKPSKKPAALSVKQELYETLSKRASVPNRSLPPLVRANCICEDDDPPAPPPPSVTPDLNMNNHNSASVVRENEYVESPLNPVVVRPRPSRESSFNRPRPSATRRPTTIKVPSKSASFSVSDHVQDSPPPPLPPLRPVGNLNTPVNDKQSPTPALTLQIGPEPSLPPRRLSARRSLPPRPPPARVVPARPPPSGPKARGPPNSASWEAPPKPLAQKPKKKGPVLPPRPNPGHCLYNKYTLQLPHGIATVDYNGSSAGELSFQKNEVLLLLEETDHDVFECQVGDARGRVQTSRMKVITPLASVCPPPQATPSSFVAGAAGPDGADNGLKVQVKHDFVPEGPGELGLRAGDVVTMVEQVDREWYRGTCRGSTGFFPVNYVKALSNSPKPLPERRAKPPTTLSGPRCVARFDFEGEHSDELSFSAGDVIQLKAYVGQDWARGQMGAFTGIFPLNFVEIVEGLPPTTSLPETRSTRMALPGMVASPRTQPEVAKASQASQSAVEWVVALYDFAGNADGDLSFQQGDYIQISKHIDADWSCGRLNGREGMFPRTFVESSAGQQSSSNQQDVAAGGSRARAMYDFASSCDEELALQVGDIITNLESVDDEWFLGDLRGRRAMMPKNYVQVLH